MTHTTDPASALRVPVAPQVELVPYISGNRTLVVAINLSGRCIGRLILEDLLALEIDPGRIVLGDIRLSPEKSA